MKKTTFLLLGILLQIPLFVFSQVKPQVNNDAFTRASYASFYIEETSEEFFSGYTTAFGEGCANIVLKHFRDLQPLPDIKMLSITSSDKLKIEQLIKKLNELRENPPSWGEIYKLEEQKLIQWDKSIRQKSKYR